MAGTNRILSVSAAVAAALSFSVSALAQQAPPSGTTASKPDDLDIVVVTGVRQSLAQGLENKREATQVVESVVAEASPLSKLPLLLASANTTKFWRPTSA